jgi:ubiquitin-protein ligase E3 C
MIPTFTGSGKRARNINLSGRPISNPFAAKTSNPFAATSSTAPGSQTAIAAAQQDRIVRQRERERLQGASKIQKTWRDFDGRRKKREERRREWDRAEAEAESGDVAMTQEEEGRSRARPYRDEEEANRQTEGLIEFFEAKKSQDLNRLERWLDRVDGVIGPEWAACDGASHGRGQSRDVSVFMRRLPAALLYLQRKCLTHMTKNITGYFERSVDAVLQLITRMQDYVPETSALASSQYYRTLALLSQRFGLRIDYVVKPLSASLHDTRAEQLLVEALARYVLVLPLHKLSLEDIQKMFLTIGCKAACLYTATFLERQTESWFSSEVNASERLNLLINLIYCYRFCHGLDLAWSVQRSYVFAIGRLLSSLVDFVQVESTALSENDYQTEGIELDKFEREQLYALIEQRYFSVIVAQIDPVSESGSGETRVLASYILTLLRMFPRRGDEIRMWLYLGLSGIGSAPKDKVDVVTYFWRAATGTELFARVFENPRAAISVLKPRALDPASRETPAAQLAHEQRDIDEQWRVILIFIELYMFVLKVMDDEEFFSNDSRSSIYGNTSGQKNSLTLNDLQRLSTFLKHLGFTMYYNAADIIDHPADEANYDLGSLFRVNDGTATRQDVPTKRPPTYIAGVQGMTLDYVKGLVTGLMRAIYERDSRRPFMPKAHWLMTSRFDMTHFIDAVVEEEERRTKVQEQDDDDQSEDEEDTLDTSSRTGLVGTSYVQRTRRLEQLQRQQRKASRKRYLQAVAPRLEILQNMPYIIPFTTRVQIFRRFVYLDQVKARGGVDPDIMNMMNPGAGRHQAKIRREHEFQDAYEQFYDLGAALKQPISISFVDRFDTVEAGIDGGGVTKEFLTSVTGEAFRPNTDGIRMFAENDQHLLFPNPSALDEQKELLREAGIKEGSDDWRLAIQDLLQKYEFLGRIIGKCLYENILVDVGFAGFFLLKWALTGGAGQAPKESGYRANLNDLRDFDEGLYQGLVSTPSHRPLPLLTNLPSSSSKTTPATFPISA